MGRYDKKIAGIAKYIDHTALSPDATALSIKKLCDEAKEFGFYSVCVNSSRVPLCKTLLEGSTVKICAVVGFPLGACATGAKAEEARIAVESGANEIDMVMNIGALKDGNVEFVENDIRRVVSEAAVPVKVILETCLLSDDEIILACGAAVRAGAAFVKTSTGFSDSGADARNVALMKEAVGDSVRVKASGGIRSLDAAISMINAGASRIGASASVKIALEERAKQNI